MTTRLIFEAPADLSVGHVTVERADGGWTKAWVATPNHKGFDLESVTPGIYTAEVAPAGLRPRSYVFEVKPGVANTVTMPLYSVLAAGGNAVAFAGVDDMQAAVDSLQKSPSGLESLETGVEAVRTEIWALASDVAPARILSIGLAQDEDVDQIGGWTPYAEGEPTVELEGGGLNVLIQCTAEALVRHPRLRLSAALEGVRTERMMVPVFRGGTRVAFRASPLVTADIAIEVTPLDPERRALLRALQAGVDAEAKAVFNDVLKGGSIARFVDGPEEDPWAAMVATLLTIRFPDLFGQKPPSWGPKLARLYPWASDVHVILARHHLVAAGQDGDRKAAARDALAALAKARSMGSPYFSYTNQLMGEMLGALAELEDFDVAIETQARGQLNAWRSDVPLQRSAGAIFSWQAADQKLQARGQVAPYRGTGALSDRYARILVRGQVDGSGISVLAPSADAVPPKALEARSAAKDAVVQERIDGSGTAFASAGPSASKAGEAPGLKLPATVPDDPHKGRFGGAAARDGYTLLAAFEEGPGGYWADIHLTVRAAEFLAASYSDVVEFFLHPTFSPNRIKASFRGREASLTVRASGGFTVGVWLPDHDVELESDLALLPGAPRVVREL